MPHFLIASDWPENRHLTQVCRLMHRLSLGSYAWAVTESADRVCRNLSPDFSPDRMRLTQRAVARKGPTGGWMT